MTELTVSAGCPGAERLSAQDLWAALQPPNTHTSSQSGLLAPPLAHSPHCLTQGKLFSCQYRCLALLMSEQAGGPGPPLLPQDRPATSALGMHKAQRPLQAGLRAWDALLVHVTQLCSLLLRRSCS